MEYIYTMIVAAVVTAVVMHVTRMRNAWVTVGFRAVAAAAAVVWLYPAIAVRVDSATAWWRLSSWYKTAPGIEAMILASMLAVIVAVPLVTALRAVPWTTALRAVMRKIACIRARSQA